MYTLRSGRVVSGDMWGGGRGGNEDASRELTWYNLKKVSSWFVWIRCELVDLASLQRYTALKHKERCIQILDWNKCNVLVSFLSFLLLLLLCPCIIFSFHSFYRSFSSSISFHIEMEILKCAMFDFTWFVLTLREGAIFCWNISIHLLSLANWCFSYTSPWPSLSIRHVQHLMSFISGSVNECSIQSWFR